MQRIAVAERRAALFDAAVQVIARDGVIGATTRAIVAEAGMPLASFHYAFRSREAMLAELVTSLLAEQRGEVEAAVENSPNLAAFAAGALDAYFDRVVRNPEIEQALVDLVTWCRTVPSLAELPDRIYAEYQSSMEAMVLLAQTRYDCTWLRPASDVARFIVAAVDGVTARWLIERDEAAARRTFRLTAAAVLGFATGSGA